MTKNIIVVNKKGGVLKDLHPMSDEYLNSDFTDSKAGSITLMDGIFNKCKFIAANLDEAIIAGKFIKCDFTNALLNRTIFRNGAMFEECLFNYADFTGNMGLWIPRFDVHCDLEKIVGAERKWEEEFKHYSLVNKKGEGQIKIVRRMPPALDNFSGVGGRDYRGSFARNDYSWRDRTPINTQALYDHYEDYYQDYTPVNKSATLLSSNEEELKVG